MKAKDGQLLPLKGIPTSLVRKDDYLSWEIPDGHLPP